MPFANFLKLEENFLEPMRFLLVLALLYFLRSSDADKQIPQVSFSFSEFPQSSELELNFEAKARLGNTSVRNNVLELNPGADNYENTMGNSKADVTGSVFYKQPIHFINKFATASFRTVFALAMKPVYPSNTGDGIAFVITSQPRGNGDSLGNFGFFHHGRKKHATLAVEFDSFNNHELFDLDSNHVGVDLDDPVSKAAVSAHSVGVVLNSGRPVTAWIDYYAPREILEVRIAIGMLNHSRPVKALIVLPLSLRDVVEDNMWVGFSAGTHYGYNQMHYIYSWSFSVDEIAPDNAGLSKAGKIALIVVLCGAFVLLVLGFLILRHRRSQAQHQDADVEQENKSWGKKLAELVLADHSGSEGTKTPTTTPKKEISHEEEDIPGVMANCLPFQRKRYHHNEDEEQEKQSSPGCLPRIMSPRAPRESSGAEQYREQSDDDTIMYSNSMYTSDEEDEDLIIPVYPYDAYPDERIDSIAYNKPRQYKPANPHSRSPPRSRHPSPPRKRG